MLKLLKYELLRRKNEMIAFGIITLFVELLILNFVRIQTESSIFSLVFLGFLAFVLVIWVFFSTITNYYSDFKKSQGTLLFLTPIKGQSLILSKLVFALIQLIVAALVFALCAWVANLVAMGFGYTSLLNLISISTGLDGLEISLMELSKQIQPMKDQFPINLFITEVALLTVLDFFNNIMMAFTAITIGRTLLSRNSLNWLYALLIYFGLNITLQFFTGAIVMPFVMSDIIQLESSVSLSLQMKEGFEFGQKMVVIDGLISLAVLIGGFFASSALINKKIDI